MKTLLKLFIVMSVCLSVVGCQAATVVFVPARTQRVVYIQPPVVSADQYQPPGAAPAYAPSYVYDGQVTEVVVTQPVIVVRQPVYYEPVYATYSSSYYVKAGFGFAWSSGGYGSGYSSSYCRPKTVNKYYNYSSPTSGHTAVPPPRTKPKN